MKSRVYLTAEQKAEIRGRYAAGGVLQRELAAEYGCSQALVRVVCAGVVMADIPCPRCPKGARKRAGHRGAHVTSTQRRHLITTKEYPHGTTARYVLNRCRCEECKAARAAYERNRQRKTAYGQWDVRVDAARARDHLRRLADAGVGYKRVAVIAGVTASTLSRVLGSRTGKGGAWRPARYRPIRRLKQSTVDRIIAVTVSEAKAPGARMSFEQSELARRRVAELVAAGVRKYRIAIYLDPDLERFVGHGKRPGLQVTKHRLITRKHFEAIAQLHGAFFDGGRLSPEEWRRVLPRRESRKAAA